jgi:hypothetical protein
MAWAAVTSKPDSVLGSLVVMGTAGRAVAVTVG